MSPLRGNNESGNFEEVWRRVQKECQIKNMTQLSKILEVSQQNVSKKKNLGFFPPEWAYIIAVKYQILTEWIMTGNGPKSLKQANSHNSSGKQQHEFMLLITKWFDEIITNDPGREDWFRYTFIDTFPKFKDWLSEREAEGNQRKFIRSRDGETVA